jgi:hypothetical protein
MAINKAYEAKMKPYAQRAATALKMPYEAVITQWSVESGDGTSDLARLHNNHAGIKVPSSRKFYGSSIPGSPFAHYSSLDAFTNDYISNMSLKYYNDVRAAGSVEDTFRALAASPWDAGHYTDKGVQGLTLFERFGISMGKDHPPQVAVCPTCHRPL